MKITLDIKDNQVANFLEIIRSLDYVSVKLPDKEVKLTSSQKKAIDEGLLAAASGNTIPHHLAMQQLAEKHPKYFKK